MTRPLSSLPVAALATLALGASALTMSSVVLAQPGDDIVVQAATQNTPKNWKWELRDGKRVPRGERVTNADGSWRETTKVGDCTTVREHSPVGEYKEQRRCD
jgi:hypothetical protein